MPNKTSASTGSLEFEAEPPTSKQKYVSAWVSAIYKEIKYG